MLRRALLLFLFGTILASAAPISDVALVYENSISYLALKITPENGGKILILTPEDIQLLSNGQFSLEENLSFEINATNTTSLYEIDESQNESLFIGISEIWCGGTSNDCNKCNGMPLGTYEWCNGEYPKKSYNCYNWCYTYRPGVIYEKAQSGSFVKNHAKASIIFEKTGEIFSLDEVSPSQTLQSGSAQIIITEITPRQQPLPLIRPYTSNTWKAVSDSDFQNYKMRLFSYLASYTLGIDQAIASTANLNSALNVLTSNAQGEHANFYEETPSPPSYPQISLKIRSDVAGVLAIRGMPKIISLNPNAKIENGMGFFELEIKNVGASGDTFLAAIACENSTNSSNSPSALVPASQTTTLKIFFEKISSPLLCEAYAQVLGEPSQRDSISITLNPFKLPCPAEKQCCSSQPGYEDRECASKDLFKSQDSCGNGYYYAQHYACTSFTCEETTTEIKNSITGMCATPTPAQQSNLGGYTNFASEAGSRYPTPSPSPTTSTLVSPTPKIGTFQKIELLEEKIEISAPNNIKQGYAGISIFSNSKPAQGSIILFSPTYKKHSIELSLGSAEALFDEIGEWKITYKDEIKYVLVNPIVIGGEEKKAPSEATAMIALNLAKLPLFESAVLVLLCSFLFVGFKAQSERIRFRKNFENNIVRLEISNNKTDLRNLEITDIVPEGNILSTISNPPSEVTEIIFGKHIKWKKNELKKGERLLISYSIFSQSKMDSLREAELLADIGGNKKVRVLSNAVLSS